MTKSRKISFDLLSTLAARALLILSSLATSIITTRLLGPFARGEYFACLTLSTMAIQFGHLGLAPSICFWAAKHPKDRDQLGVNLLWVSIVLGLLGSLVIFLCGRASPLKLLLVSLSVPFGIYNLLGGNWLIGIGRIHEYNLIEAGGRLSTIGMLLITGWLCPSVEGFLLVITLSGALVSLVTGGQVMRNNNYLKPNIQLLRTNLNYAMRAWLCMLIEFGIARVNVIFITHYLGNENLGIWSVAIQIGDMLMSVPQVICQVLFPRLVVVDEPWGVMKGYALRVGLLVIGLLLITFIIGLPVIKFAFGKAFEPAYIQLLWMFPCVFCRSLISVLSQYLGALGMPAFVPVVWAIALTVEVFCSFILVPRFKGIGAMAALSVAYLFALCALWLTARYRLLAKSRNLP